MDWINSINMVGIKLWIYSLRESIDLYNQEIMYFSYVILALGLFQNFTYFMQRPLAGIELLRIKMRPSDEHNLVVFFKKEASMVQNDTCRYKKEVSFRG